MEFFDWLQASAFARAVGESFGLTAWLSALHVIGFTLVLGAGVPAALRAIGVVLGPAAGEDVARVSRRLLATGLTVSILTGLFLFAPRAGYTIDNGTFQLKLVLIVAAVLFHFFVLTPMLRRGRALATGAVGAVGLVLWLGLAVTACWFILFE